MSKVLVDLTLDGQSLEGLSAKNTMDIKYTLASEDNAVIRDIEVDDDGNHFVESESDDLVTIFTQFPDSLVDGLYWGSFEDVGGSPDGALLVADDTIEVASGVALDDLEVSFLPQFIVTLTNNSASTISLNKITINDVTIFSDDNHYAPSASHLLKEFQNYQSFDLSVLSSIDIEITFNLSSSSRLRTLNKTVDLTSVGLDSALLVEFVYPEE